MPFNCCPALGGSSWQSCVLGFWLCVRAHHLSSYCLRFEVKSLVSFVILCHTDFLNWCYLNRKKISSDSSFITDVSWVLLFPEFFLNILLELILWTLYHLFFRTPASCLLAFLFFYRLCWTEWLTAVLKIITCFYHQHASHTACMCTSRVCYMGFHGAQAYS